MTDLADRIGTQAARKLKACRDATRGMWSGLGMMGLIAWSVVVPTLLGTTLGLWLDDRAPSDHPWTLGLLMAGLIIGCLNAWHWVAWQSKSMWGDDTERDSDE